MPVSERGSVVDPPPRFVADPEPDLYLVVVGRGLWLRGRWAEGCTRALIRDGHRLRWCGPISGWWLPAHCAGQVLDYAQDRDLRVVTNHQVQVRA